MPFRGVELDQLQQTCRACPSQWEGVTRRGVCVYIRYRWGVLQVGTGATMDAAVDDDSGPSISAGRPLNGFMDTATMLALTGFRIGGSRRCSTRARKSGIGAGRPRARHDPRRPYLPQQVHAVLTVKHKHDWRPTNAWGCGGRYYICVVCNRVRFKRTPLRELLRRRRS